MRARLVHLAVFFVVGGLLHGARRTLADRLPGPRPSVEVTVTSGASEAERRLAIREALLVEEGLRSAWAPTDPVIRDRLVRNMRFVDEGNGDASALMEQAWELGMHRSDPVVRQRLVWHARNALRASIELPAPSDRALGEYLREHSERFAVPGTVRFTHTFLSAQRRGDSLDADATNVAEALQGRGIDAAAEHSDPSLLPRSMAGSHDRIDARFGPGFSKLLVGLPTGRWAGPVRSSFGVHFVWVEGREPAGMPALAEVRERVRKQWEQDAMAQQLERAADGLTERYDVQLREVQQ